MESVADCTATSTTSTLDASSPSTACPTNSELASTPSTVLGPSFDNSGSSVRTASSPAEPMDDGSLSPVEHCGKPNTLYCVLHIPHVFAILYECYSEYAVRIRLVTC